MKVLIVIPTYNERENIQRVIKEIMPINTCFEVLVVDDNSPDGTAAIVERIIAGEKRVHLLNREEKNGLGPAYLAGFRWALERDYDVVMEMDADLSHRPKYLPGFIEGIQNSDIVVGSRWMPGGGIENWPITRVLLSRMASVYCRLILGVAVYDMTAGFIAYRRKVLETLDLDAIHSDGYSFQIEMKYRALQHGFTIKEIPITFTDRTAGVSKISRRIIIEALLRVWSLKFSKKPRPKTENLRASS